MKPKAIIFDLDGTLADCRHRLKHLPNYGKFFDAMKEDTPIQPIVDFAKWMYLHHLMCKPHYRPENLTHVLIVTGRPDSHQIQTCEWLAKHGMDYSKLYMRKEGDHRPDYVVKDEIRRAIEQEYSIQLVIDDRPQVVNMWRNAGYVCLQNEWHGDDKPKYAPGTLYIMVGPSGAGKDHFLTQEQGKYIPVDTICANSDGIRQFLCGDFRDQSKNEQVFSYFHSFIKTTIEHGMDAVANATHIQRKARLATLQCAPKDGKVEYIVIDRPLEDKLRDAGWRKDVMVKGRSLIEHHHQVMQSNTKDILAGDGDPRVTVRDLRNA